MASNVRQRQTGCTAHRKVLRMTGSTGSGWRSFVSSAREMASDVAADPEVDRLKKRAAQGASAAVAGADRARVKVSQEQAWQEAERALSDIVDVLRTHHALLLDLGERVALLEASQASQADPKSP